jgi:hypothetical protein
MDESDPHAAADDERGKHNGVVGPIAKVLYGGRKKYQAARAKSSAVRIAGPRPRKNATRRIAGRKTIKPRSEILINQLSSKPRTVKLKRNAARAMVIATQPFA